MSRNGKYYGKLSPEMLADMDAMLQRLRRMNRGLLKNATIKRGDIRPLPDADYVRLWGYLRHCCTLVASWPNVRKAIAAIADASGRDFDSLRDECIDSMTVHVYTYAWRKYRHSDECGLVFSTAEFGFKAWITSQNMYHGGISLSGELFMADNPSCGSKVNTSFCDPR